MIFAIGILLALLIIYFLFIRGILWKGIVGAFAFYGMRLFLLTYFPSSHNICMITVGHNFMWAEIVPLVVLLMAAICSRDK